MRPSNPELFRAGAALRQPLLGGGPILSMVALAALCGCGDTADEPGPAPGGSIEEVDLGPEEEGDDAGGAPQGDGGGGIDGKAGGDGAQDGDGEQPGDGDVDGGTDGGGGDRPSDDEDPWQTEGPGAGPGENGDGSDGDGGDGNDDSGGDDGGGAGGPEDPGSLIPWPGELTIIQIHLTGLMLAESAIVVGPDGTTVLLDAGSAFHAADIKAALADVNEAIAGWPGVEVAPGPGDVDWLILTHYHADHEGGVEPLLRGDDAISIRKGVVSRGPFDVGAAAGTIAFTSACNALGEALSDDQRYELCVGDERAPCGLLAAGGPWPASGCPGLLMGDLEAPSAEPTPAYLSLGMGARVYFVAANGWAATPTGLHDSASAGAEIGYFGSNEENARSIVGVISYGDFTYTFGGDATGGGGDTPDVEGFLAALDPRPAPLPASGADVMHAHHHGSDTSNSSAIADRYMPMDGHPRNAVIGAGPAYLSNPKAEVAQRLTEHAQGGAVWASQIGALSGAGDSLIQTLTHVVVRTMDSGARYLVGPDPEVAEGADPARRYDSIP